MPFCAAQNNNKSRRRHSSRFSFEFRYNPPSGETFGCVISSQKFDTIKPPSKKSEGGCRYLLSTSEISFGTYLPLFLRDFTHSVRRYSICPLTDLKSLSAHRESSSNNSALILSGICFFFPSFILIKTSRIYYGLSVAIAAKNN